MAMYINESKYIPRHICEDVAGGTGSTKRTNHVECGDTRGRLYVTNLGVKLLAYCHNCNAKGAYRLGPEPIIPDTHRYWEQFSGRDKTSVDLAPAYNYGLHNHIDGKSVSQKLQAWANVHHESFLVKDLRFGSGITGDAWHEYLRNGYNLSIYTDANGNLLVISMVPARDGSPFVYRYTSYTLTPSYTSPDGVKKTNFANIKHIAEENKPSTTVTLDSSNRSGPFGNDTVVIVEDKMSAVAGAMACSDFTWACLYGKHISHEDLAVLAVSFPNVVIWLDPDAAGQSATTKIYNDLRMYTPSSSYVSTSPEPRKCHPKIVDLNVRNLRRDAIRRREGT